ncbi:MAG: site-specific integrase [Geobacteraceae bacterium]|nr:site-specific integrase [Geobacteraceae bacterium]
MALTNTQIKNFKPADKAVDHADTGGLYLRVYPTGTKTFMYRSRVGGKARWMALDTYPTLSLADARTKATELATGKMPANKTVQDAYDEWVTRVVDKTPKPAYTKWTQETYILPVFGNRKLTSLTRAELSEELNKVADRAPVAANRTLTHLRLFLAYCEERGWLNSSPAEKITKKTVGGREESRTRALDNAEISKLLEFIRTDKVHDATRWALLWLIATGQRSGEVRGLVRSEIVNGVWIIPKERTKNKKEMCVRMPTAFMRLADKMFAHLGEAPFAGMSGETLARKMRRLEFAPPATAHDLRRTMATGMANLGVHPYVIEKCLNHTMQGVMAVYNRAEYAPEKRAAWRLWVRHLLRQRKSPRLVAGG